MWVGGGEGRGTHHEVDGAGGVAHVRGAHGAAPGVDHHHHQRVRLLRGLAPGSGQWARGGGAGGRRNDTGGGGAVGL